MDTGFSINKTFLYQDHIDLGARMVPFAGWIMPIQYEGIIGEYTHCRKSVCLFDISHMGEFLFTGDVQISELDKLITCQIKDMPVLSSRYGLMLNEQGGIIDDLIIFRIEQNKYMLVVNAANIEKDFQHLERHLDDVSCIKNISEKVGKLDLQGPAARDVLEEFIPGIKHLGYFGFDYFDILGEKNIVSRTGYTGELGYEIFCSPEKTRMLWKKLLENDKVKPAGLGARDILRIEMGYSLYGQEINEEISPLEANLSRFIDFEKDFVGKSALLKQQDSGIKRKITYFLSDSRKSPRNHQPLFSSKGKEIGFVTSGTFSPSLTRGIGIGLVSESQIPKDGKILFGSQKNIANAQITKRPFYKSGSLKA